MGHDRYFLAIQTRLPEDYLADAEFRRNLETLRRLGFDGVELNISDPDTGGAPSAQGLPGRVRPGSLTFASGLTAKTFNLSLATSDEARRKEAIGRTIRFLEFAHESAQGRSPGTSRALLRTAGLGRGNAWPHPW